MAELKRKVTLKEKKSVDNKKSGSKLWLWLLLLAVVAVVVILCVIFCGNDKTTLTEPESATVEQTEATQTDEVTPEVETPTVETEGVVVSQEPANKPAETPVAKPTEPAAKPEAESKPAQKPTSTVPQGTLDEKAKQVIRGEYGNGADRKHALGSEYDAIQQRVNEIYREGKDN